MLVFICILFIFAVLLLAAYFQNNDTTTQLPANQQPQINPYAARRFYDKYAQIIMLIARSIAPTCGLISPHYVSDVKSSNPNRFRYENNVLYLTFMLRRAPSVDGATIGVVHAQIKDRLGSYCIDANLPTLRLINVTECDSRNIAVVIGGRYVP